MAQYFARIDDDNVVLEIAVVEREFLESNPERYPGTWVETFVDDPSKTYAGRGFTYDPVTNDFTPPVWPDAILP